MSAFLEVIDEYREDYFDFVDKMNKVKDSLEYACGNLLIFFSNEAEDNDLDVEVLSCNLVPNSYNDFIIYFNGEYPFDLICNICKKINANITEYKRFTYVKIELLRR